MEIVVIVGHMVMFLSDTIFLPLLKFHALQIDKIHKVLLHVV